MIVSVYFTVSCDELVVSSLTSIAIIIIIDVITSDRQANCSPTRIYFGKKGGAKRERLRSQNLSSYVGMALRRSEHQTNAKLQREHNITTHQPQWILVLQRSLLHKNLQQNVQSHHLNPSCSIHSCSSTVSCQYFVCLENRSKQLHPLGW